MVSRKSSIMVCCLMVLGLILASCAPAATPTPTAKPAATKPAGEPGAPAATPKPAAEAPQYGGILNTTLNMDMPSFDVHQETTQLTQSTVQSCYNGLLQTIPPEIDKVVGDLAEKWEASPDGTVYTFHLSKGVKFHDGSALNAEDVKYSLERVYDPPKGVLSPRKSTLEAIKEVTTPDPDTVKIALRYVQSSFLANVAVGQLVIYPKKVVEAKGNMKKDIVGTGPYMYKDYSLGTLLEVKKNPSYFVKGRPYLDGIRFYVIKDQSTMLAAFRTGRVRLMDPSWSGGLLPVQVEIIRREMPQAIVDKYPALSTRWVNMIVSQPPFTDVRVRRAVSLALDRQAFIKIIEHGEADIGTHIGSGGEWALPEAELLKLPGYRQPKDADMAEAKKVLADAGFPTGFKTKLLARTKNTDEVAVLVKDQLAKIGIEIQIDVQDAAVFLDMVDKLRYPITAQPIGPRMTDPDEMSRYLVSSGGSGWCGLKDKEIDDLFDKQSRTLDVVERKKIVRELEMKLLEISPAAVLFWRRGNTARWPEVKNYFRGNDKNNNKFQDVWLAK